MGMLDVHLTWLELETSCWRPVLPEVASATSWVVCPDAESA